MAAEPRIICLDIESIPNLQQALKVWPQLSNYPGLTFKATINTIACFGWKVLGDPAVHCPASWDFSPDDPNDDRLLCEEILRVLEGAHAVVTQNGKSFDWRFIQTRLLVHGLPSLPKIHHIDTKCEAKRNLFLFSNSLKHMAENLTESRKLENDGWDLWVRTHGGEPEAREKMREYCKGDVVALEALYLRLRKYSNGVPNHNLFEVAAADKPVCPNCGSSRLKSEGIRATQSRTYRRYICTDCGTWSRTDVKDRAPRAL